MEDQHLGVSTFLSTAVSGTNDCAGRRPNGFYHYKFPNFRTSEVNSLLSLKKEQLTCLDLRNIPNSLKFATPRYTLADIQHGNNNTRTVRPIWYGMPASHLDDFWCFDEVLRNGCNKADCTLRHAWPSLAEVEVLLMMTDDSKEKDSLKFLWIVVQTFIHPLAQLG